MREISSTCFIGSKIPQSASRHRQSQQIYIHKSKMQDEATAADWTQSERDTNVVVSLSHMGKTFANEAHASDELLDIIEEYDAKMVCPILTTLCIRTDACSAKHFRRSM